MTKPSHRPFAAPGVPCPQCDALAHQPCRSRKRALRAPHPGRVELVAQGARRDPRERYFTVRLDGDPRSAR